MSNKEENIARRIIMLYLSSDFPADVKRQIFKWLVGRYRHQEKEQVLWEQWNEVEAVPQKDERDALRRVKAELGLPGGGTLHLRRRITRFTGAAAAVILVIASTVWLIGRVDKGGIVQPQVATVITTGEGETRHLGLEDGSRLWMNEKSQASYFEDREITLSGEAFFEVASGRGEKFSVHSGDVTVTVTGTRFNFRSYANEPLALVSLYEGSVQIAAGDTVVNMTGGYLLEYDRAAGSVTVREMGKIQPDWMRDIIDFEGATIMDIVASLEKIYGMRIETTGVKGLAEEVDLKFEGGLALEEVLGFLCEISGSFTCEVDRNGARLRNK